MSKLTTYQQKTIFRQNLTNVMLAGSLYMSCKMNQNLTQINSLMNQSVRIQASIDAGVKQLNLQMAELIKIAKFQTLLMQKKQVEEKANKMMRETFFYLHEEIEEVIESEIKPIEKYFNLLSIKSSMLKNDVSTEMVESFADKKMIKDCYKTFSSEMPKLEKKFSKDDKKLAEKLFDIIAVDEESEIHKLSNSQIRLFHKIMNTRKKTVELLCKTDPCVLFTAYWDYDDRKNEIKDKNWKVDYPSLVGQWKMINFDLDSFQDSMEITMYNALGKHKGTKSKNDSEYEWKWYLTEFIPRLYKVTDQVFIKKLQKKYFKNWRKDMIFLNGSHGIYVGGQPREEFIRSYQKGGFFKKTFGLTELDKFQRKKANFLEDKENIENANKCKNYIFKAFDLEDKELSLKARVLKDDKKIKELKDNINKEKKIIKDLCKKHTWIKSLFQNRV